MDKFDVCGGLMVAQAWHIVPRFRGTLRRFTSNFQCKFFTTYKLWLKSGKCEKRLTVPRSPLTYVRLDIKICILRKKIQLVTISCCFEYFPFQDVLLENGVTIVTKIVIAEIKCLVVWQLEPVPLHMTVLQDG